MPSYCRIGTRCPLIVFKENLHYGGGASGNLTEDVDHLWNFEGDEGDFVTITLTAAGSGDLVLYLNGTDAIELEFVDENEIGQGEVISDFELPATGYYSIGVGELDFNPASYSSGSRAKSLVAKALLLPGICIVVVAILFPEARCIIGPKLQRAQPLSAFPESSHSMSRCDRDTSPRPRAAASRVLAATAPRRKCCQKHIVLHHRFQRQVRGVAVLAVLNNVAGFRFENDDSLLHQSL